MTGAEAVWIAGTRSFAAEVAGYAREAGLELAGLLEPSDRDRAKGRVHGLPVAWLEDAGAEAGALALVATGDRRRREVAARVEAAGFRSATLVHPAAHVPRSTEIGPGTIVGPGAVIGTDVRIGSQVVVGRGSLVGHHTQLADFATLGPGANVAGNSRVASDAFLGMGAVVRDHVTVGCGAVVAMGAVVVRDVEPGAEVRGLPAR